MDSSSSSLGVDAARSGTVSPETYSSASEVICVAYTDAMSIGGSSRRDLEIGCETNMVSSNQDVLDRAAVGSLVVVTSQSDEFVIGVLGKSVENCRVWKLEGGHQFKYARVFVPITEILEKSICADKWDAVCQIHGCCGKNPKYLFHSRFCGYGTWYIPALVSALKHGIIPTK